MKISKKIVTIVLMLAIASAILTPFQTKISKAANYLSAPTLSLNGVWSPDYFLTETDDEHWYKIVIPSDGKLNLQVMSYFESCHWELYTDDLSNYIASDYLYYGEETKPETNKTDIILSAGIYYLTIDHARYNYELGKYRIYALFTSYGTNDQDAVSYVSPLNYQLGEEIIGALTETDSEDWYKINIPSDGQYSFKIASYFGIYIGESPLSWRLYNSDLTDSIGLGSASGSEGVPQIDQDDFSLSKGIYYLNIYSYGTGKYTFQFSALTQQNCSHDYQSTKVAATYFDKGYSLYKCSKCGKTYKGDYTAKKILDKGYISSGIIGKKKVKISFYSISGVSGYQIRYSTNKKMKKSKIVKTGRNKTTKTIKGLKRKKKYYFQVRGYVKSGNKVAYGAWSDKKYGKIK